MLCIRSNDSHPEARGVRISRYGHDDLHVVGSGALLELALGFDEELHPAVGVALDARLDPNQWLHLQDNICNIISWKVLYVIVNEQ